MKPKNCFKCSTELIFLKSSNSYICKHCGAIESNKNLKIYSLKDIQTQFAHFKMLKKAQDNFASTWIM